MKWDSRGLRIQIYKWCKVWKCNLKVTASSTLVYLEGEEWDVDLFKSSCFHPVVTDALTGDHPSTIGSSKFADLKSAFVWGKCSEICKFKSLEKRSLQIIKQYYSIGFLFANSTRGKNPSKSSNCKDKRGWKWLSGRVIAGVVDHCFTESYISSCRMRCANYQLHMACSRSNKDGGVTRHITGTTSPWLRTKILLGPVLCGLVERSHWGNLFQVLPSLDTSSYYRWATFHRKISFWDANSETGCKDISDSLRSSDVWKSMHERFYSN